MINITDEENQIDESDDSEESDSTESEFELYFEFLRDDDHNHQKFQHQGNYLI